MKKNFKIVETILWDKKIKDDSITQDGFFLLKYHINRLIKSSKYFNFNFKKSLLIKKLKNLVKNNFDSHKKYKVRVLLSKNGKINIQYHTFKKDKIKLKKIILSTKKIDRNNIFLYHKTTNRKIYNQEYNKYKKLGYYDVLFKNNLGQITEFSKGNIFLQIRNNLITPPINCGLLNGTFRKYLLSKKKNNIIIRPVYEDDLYKANKIFFTNSIRKIVEVKI